MNASQPMSAPDWSQDPVAQRLLDAAEDLFYRRGVRGVGVDAVVAQVGVATKTLYALFGSKDGLVEAYLRRRHDRWLAWLREATLGAAPGEARLLSVFDAMETWFRTPGFSGCAFINLAGELAPDPKARRIAAEHKAGLRALLRELAAQIPDIDAVLLGDRIMLLVEGSIVGAHVESNLEAARTARGAAAALIAAAPRTRAVN